MANTGLQLRFIGSIPHGEIVGAMQHASQFMSSHDGVVVVGQGINPACSSGLMAIVNAAVSLAHSGCINVGVYWALPF